jgi:thymidylate kinase
MAMLMDAKKIVTPIPTRAELLTRVFNVLDREKIAWCVLHGYETWPQQIGSDVDLLVDPRLLPNELAKTLYAHRDEIGAEPVLWLNDGAQFIVLCAQGEASPVILQLHISGNYSLAGRTFYEGQELLASRDRRDNFWIPAPHHEFGCVIVNRVIKMKLRPEHEKKLSDLVANHPAACEREARRFFPAADVRVVMQAARGNDWAKVHRYAKELRTEMLKEGGAPRNADKIGAAGRRIGRWMRPPCGLHVVFLGPDGVGKSTVIEAVRHDLSPIFLSEKYLTFAPGLLPSRFEALKPDGPHSLPPRSYPASLVKAAWWCVCYTLGYLVTIHSALARATLVVNHRYLPDAIVDPKRYRYSGPQWILRALWQIAPKPHLLMLLDAPAEVIQARKKEVAPEETARQRDGYRALANECAFAHIIDNSRPLPEVVGEIEQIILDYMASRTASQRKAARS